MGNGTKLRRLAKRLWVKVSPMVGLGRILLHLDAVGEGVLADSGHLPGNFGSGCVRLNDEGVVFNLSRDSGMYPLVVAAEPPRVAAAVARARRALATLEQASSYRMT